MIREYSSFRDKTFEVYMDRPIYGWMDILRDGQIDRHMLLQIDKHIDLYIIHILTH